MSTSKIIWRLGWRSKSKNGRCREQGSKSDIFCLYPKQWWSFQDYSWIQDFAYMCRPARVFLTLILTSLFFLFFFSDISTGALDSQKIWSLCQDSPWKVYMCHVCCKKCVKRDDIVRHARIHTGEKPYPCTVCGKAFREKHHAINHRRTVHKV